MPKYRVVKTFPANEPMYVGKIVEDPNWRNLSLLLKQKYLVEVTEEAPAEIADRRPVEFTVESARISWHGPEQSAATENDGADAAKGREAKRATKEKAKKEKKNATNEK